MKFSEILAEYLDLRENEVLDSEGKSISENSQLRRERIIRMEQILLNMDTLTPNG